jgi:enamine deaminase RidA (YjgF/YER057c/UK114 family)
MIEERLAELGLVLPDALVPPPGHTPPSAWVRVHGSRVLVSGHGPLQPDGSPAPPFGRVPDEVSLEDAQQSARLAALAIMASARRAVGDLDRIAAWVSVSGFVQAQPGYANTTAVLNAFSEVVLDVFGAERGTHARTAVGAAALPLNLPVIVAAELALAE